MRNVTPCPNWRELLSAYQDNNVSPKDRKRVAAHLQTCGDCRQALAQMDGDRDRFIDAYMAPAAKADLRDTVLAALRADAAIPAEQPQRKFPWDLLFHLGKAGAAVTLILLVAVFMGREPAGNLPATKNPSIFNEETDTTGDTTILLNTDQKLYQNSIADSYSEDGTVDAPDYLSPAKVYAARVNPDYGMNSYLYTVDGDGNLVTPSYGMIDDPGNALTLDQPKNRLYASNGNNPVMAYDALVSVKAKGSKIPSKPAGLKMAYDIDYRLQVKNALQKSRQAQGIITGLGGFTMNYQYVNNEHEPAVAAFNGKIPAEKAEAALAEIEKLGNVRGLTIAGEDLTGQFQSQREEIARQTEHAKKLDAIGSRSASKVAAGVEDQRHAAKGQVNAAKNALTGLTTRHELVTISAAFYEATPREPLTLARATAGTRHALNYALLLLVTIAVFFLVVGLVAAPFVGLRYWRRRRMAS
ncbi:MAG: DUF4349 domain-containing protein [Armatimonadota bacterium]